MPNTLRISIWNSNGLTKHLPELEMFLHEQKIDIMLISESHFTRSSFARIQGYSCYNALHAADRARGGSTIFIKENIEHYEDSKIEQEIFQVATVNVEFKNFRKFKISSIYSPPRHNIKQDQYKNLLKQHGDHFIIGGDFNAKHLYWGSRTTTPKGKELFHALKNLKCQTYSGNSPTYWPTNTQYIPDLIDFFIAKGISKENVHLENYEGLPSDHSAVILTISDCIIEKNAITPLINKKTDWAHFKHILNDKIHLNVPLKTKDEIEEEVNNLTEAIQFAAWNSTPIILPQSNNKIFPIEVRELLSKKRRARKHWQQERTPENKRILNRLSSQLKKLIKSIKNRTTSSFLQNLSSCEKTNYSLWKATKQHEQPTTHIPPIRRADNTWARSAQEKADIFAHHLKNTFMPLPRQTSQENTAQINKIDEQHITPITYNELVHVIKYDLSPKKAPGYDLITGKLIKRLTEKAVRKLLHIINACFRLKYVPLQWKVAEIIMIHKPGKQPNEATSYRPISLLPIISKIFEKLLLKRLRPIIEDRNLIPTHQFGFRVGHSTIEQVHRLMDVAETSLENRNICSAVFLDVGQAFDRVWHAGLLYKLHRDLPRQFFEILRSYLSQRNFRVRHETAYSSLKNIEAGVPQGSVLGPILYLLYTRDLPPSPTTTLATFADDTAILSTAKTFQEASWKTQSSLTSIVLWLKKWRMALNENKSIHMYFTNRPISYHPVYMNNVIIPYANTAKYLGMTLDTKIKWKEHVKKKSTQIQLKFNELQWLIGQHSQLSTYNKLLIYKQVIKPIWTYGIPLWGCTKRKHIEKIQKLQNKILRSMVNAPWFVRNKDLHRDLKINTVYDEVVLQAQKHASKLQSHENRDLNRIFDTPSIDRRLQRILPMDLAR